MRNLTHPRFNLSFNILKFLIVLFLSVSIYDTFAQLPGYGYRKELTIDNTKVSGASNLLDFPVLISEIDLDFRTVANGGDVENANGYDIRFTNSDGLTLLDHQTEKYVATTGELIVWIKVDTVFPSVDTKLYLYYGNASISSGSSTTNTWDTNYMANWHLSEDPSGATPQMKDSTLNANDLTSNGSMTTGDQVSSKINGGIDVDGKDDYFLRANDTDFDFGTGSFTSSGWFKTSGGTENIATVSSRVATGNDDAEENAGTGGMYRNSSDLELINDGSNDQIVGMRFQNIGIPQGAIIANAYIEYECDEPDAGATNLTFYGEDIDNTGTFTSANYDISNRTKTSASVDWNSIAAWTVNNKYQTPDLTSIVQEIVNRGGWVSGNSMVIIVEGSGERTAESYEGESANAAQLIIDYLSATNTLAVRVSTGNDDAEENASTGGMNLTSSDMELISDGGTAQIVGIRLQNVTIPQGTTINSAYIEFECDEADAGATNLTFYGEDIDNAAQYTTTNSDISNRTKTTASIAWPAIPAWTVNTKYQSPDLTSIVQEIINRGGWASGNSMAFIIEGSGERTAESYNGESGAAAYLVVNYNTTSSISAKQYFMSRYNNDAGFKVWMGKSGEVSFGIDDDAIWGPDISVSSSGTYDDDAWHNYTAVKENNDNLYLYIDGSLAASQSGVSSPTVSVRVSTGNDDAEENASTGGMNLTSSDMELISDGATAQIVGIRLQNVTIPRGTTINSAYIEFECDEADAGATNLTFYGEDIDNAAQYTTTNSDISNRTKTTASVAWSAIPAWTVDTKYQSPDLISIVQEIVNRGGWASGNSMAFIIEGTGERTAESFNGESGAAALLVVNYVDPFGSLNSTAQLTVGVNQPVNNFSFGGVTDEVRISNIARSADWTATEYNNQNSPSTFYFMVSVPLPIELLAFDAVLENEEVLLTWTTAVEINNDYFTVEKTADGTAFEQIIEVNGAGNSNTLLEYNTTDYSPYKGISYYRLKQTDYDGKYTYSDIVTVEYNVPFANKPTLLLFPNPTTNENINVKLQGFDQEKEVLVAVLDQTGREFYSKVVITDSEGAITTAIDPYNNLTAGLYLVIGSSDNSIDSDFLIITQ